MKNYDVDQKAVVKMAIDYFRKATKSKEKAQALFDDCQKWAQTLVAAVNSPAVLV